jgi:hypothetical protein
MEYRDGVSEPQSGPPPTGPVDPRTLRVSDAEREYVVGLLQKAIGQGLITLDEFTTRTDTALAARTRSELNVVLVDLPGLVHQSASAPTHPEQVELRATMSTIRRTGRWVVPRELVVHNRMGKTELDFTEARIDHPEVHVDLDVSGGSVVLLLPADASVRCDDVEVIAATIHDNRTGEYAGRPHFEVTGTIRAGSLKIRRPTYVRIGALVLRRPWKVSWQRDQPPEER